MLNPVGCRRKQPVFFDVRILPVRVVEGASVPSAETKVSLQKNGVGLLGIGKESAVPIDVARIADLLGFRSDDERRSLLVPMLQFAIGGVLYEMLHLLRP